MHRSDKLFMDMVFKNEDILTNHIIVNQKLGGKQIMLKMFRVTESCQMKIIL